MLNNRRAQIGETITWIPATIIVILILLISLYATLVMSKAREISSLAEIGSSEESADIISLKTEIALEKNDLNSEIILKWVSEGENG